MGKCPKIQPTGQFLPFRNLITGDSLLIQKVFHPLTIFKKSCQNGWFNALFTATRRLCIVTFAFVLLAGCTSESTDGDLLGSGPQLQESVSGAAYARLAQQMEAQGDYGSAMNLYQRAMGHSMHAAERGDKALMDMSMSGYIRMALRLGFLDQIEKNYSGWFTITQKDPKIIASYVEALLRTGRLDDARSTLQTHMDAGLDSAELWTLKGVMADLALDHDTARRFYDQALSQTISDGRDTAPLIMNMALSYALTGDFAAAKGLMAEVPNVPGAIANRASIEALLGNIDAANALMRPMLDAASLRSNMAFYQQLQTMEPHARARAVLLGIAD